MISGCKTIREMYHKGRTACPLTPSAGSLSLQATTIPNPSPRLYIFFFQGVWEETLSIALHPLIPFLAKSLFHPLFLRGHSSFCLTYSLGCKPLLLILPAKRSQAKREPMKNTAGLRYEPTGLHHQILRLY